MIYTPNIRRLELHITYRCTLKCQQCHTLVPSAPTNELMTVADVHELLKGSNACSHQWELINLHGGEPTTHPHFLDIARMLAYYRRKHPETTVALCTNGYTQHTKLMMQRAKQMGFRIDNSSKDGNARVSYHQAFCVSPSDTGDPAELGCFQTTDCGIAYNKAGFWECSPAAAMSRVFGFKSSIQSVKDLSAERLACGFAEHCKHCGYSRINKVANPDAGTSKTWAEALARYRNIHGQTSSH